MTIRRWLRSASERIAVFAGQDAGFEARQMAIKALGMSHAQLLAEGGRVLNEAERAALDALLFRRIDREPLQYILGEWEFMGLPFRTDARALIPRQDTETLAEAALEVIRAGGGERLLDVFTGSGCIGISLAKLGGVSACLSDISEECLALAAENARLNGVECKLLHCDVFDGIEERFDIITANPPYIERCALSELSAEVAREPLCALNGGVDGLDFYRRIAAGYARRLNPGGTLFLEIGFDQAERVRTLFAGADTKLIKDIRGLDRVITVTPRFNRRRAKATEE